MKFELTKEFLQEIIDKMKLNKSLLEERFSYHENPVMHGIIDSLFNL